MASATEAAVLKPRVPIDKIDEARTWTNPFDATPENIDKGRALFHGKAFCVTCHGKDGKGLVRYPRPRRKTPAQFHRQEVASRSHRWGTVLDFEARQQGHGDGLFYSARADGRRSLAGAAICAVIRSAINRAFMARFSFPSILALLRWTPGPGMFPAARVMADWSAIAETKVSYTDNVTNFSAARRLKFSEDPSQPTALPSQLSDVIWDPSLKVIRSSSSTLGPNEFSIKAQGFIFTNNPIYNHGDFRATIQTGALP